MIRFRRTAVAMLAVASIGASAAPEPARAGEFTHVLCTNPDTGRGVVSGPVDGVTVSETTPADHFAIEPSCAKGAASPLYVAGQVRGTTNAVGAHAKFMYDVPSTLGIAGGVLYRSFNGGGNYAYATGPGATWMNAGMADVCSSNTSCTRVGTGASAFAGSNRVEFGAVGRSLHFGVSCFIPDTSWTCDNNLVQFWMYGARVRLTDSVAPEAGEPTGSVAAGRRLAGTEDLRFVATDSGAGVQDVVTLVDGVVIDRRAAAGIDPDRCADVNPANDDPREFAYRRPCADRSANSLSFDTTTWPEGTHKVKVLARDASGNDVAVLDRSVTIDNVADPVATPPSSGGAIPLPARGAAGSDGRDGRDGSAGAGADGADGGPSGPAVPNGDGASARARLTATFHKAVKNSHGLRGKVVHGRSLEVTGRLVDETGRPIRNAVIDIVETRALPNARTTVLRPVVTGADGGFAHTASAGAGTRKLAFQYRHLREGAVVAEQTLSMSVASRVTLTARLKGAVVSYGGRVLAGAMPRGGKVVILQGRRAGARWQTFASRRAGRTGRFKGGYRLKVRRPGVRLQFRARVLGESGWNFGASTSNVVTRVVR